MRLFFQILEGDQTSLWWPMCLWLHIPKDLILVLSNSVCSPFDWKSMAKSYVNLGDYLLFKTEFTELYQDQVQHNFAHETAITDLLIGTEIYEGAGTNHTILCKAYQRINIATLRAWRHLSNKETKPCHFLRFTRAQKSCTQILWPSS